MSLKYSKAEIKTWSRILEILRIIEIFQLSRQILEIPQNPKIPQKSRYCRICLQNTISTISVPIRVSYILFDTHLGKKRRKRKVKIDRKRGKKGEFIKKGWRFTTNHAVFSSKNINCVAFPPWLSALRSYYAEGNNGLVFQGKGYLWRVYFPWLCERDKRLRRRQATDCACTDNFLKLPCRLIASDLGKQSCCYMNN